LKLIRTGSGIYFFLNMRSFRKLLAVISLLIPASLFLSCSGFGEIEVGDIEDVRFSKLALKSVEFEVQLTIDNPTAFRYRIIDVDLDVFINNEYLGNIRNVDNVLIPGRSSELYTFPLRAEFSSILGSALSMYRFYLDRNADIRVSGTITARSFPFTKKIPVNEATEVNMNR
jgi:LEA14-like dessication related protein